MARHELLFHDSLIYRNFCIVLINSRRALNSLQKLLCLKKSISINDTYRIFYSWNIVFENYNYWRSLILNITSVQIESLIIDAVISDLCARKSELFEKKLFICSYFLQGCECAVETCDYHHSIDILPQSFVSFDESCALFLQDKISLKFAVKAAVNESNLPPVVKYYIEGQKNVQSLSVSSLCIRELSKFSSVGEKEAQYVYYIISRSLTGNQFAFSRLYRRQQKILLHNTSKNNCILTSKKRFKELAYANKSNVKTRAVNEAVKNENEFSDAPNGYFYSPVLFFFDLKLQDETLSGNTCSLFGTVGIKKTRRGGRRFKKKDRSSRILDTAEVFKKAERAFQRSYASSNRDNSNISVAPYTFFQYPYVSKSTDFSSSFERLNSQFSENNDLELSENFVKSRSHSKSCTVEEEIQNSAMHSLEIQPLCEHFLSHCNSEIFENQTQLSPLKTNYPIIKKALKDGELSHAAQDSIDTDMKKYQKSFNMLLSLTLAGSSQVRCSPQVPLDELCSLNSHNDIYSDCTQSPVEEVYPSDNLITESGHACTSCSLDTVEFGLNVLDEFYIKDKCDCLITEPLKYVKSKETDCVYSLRKITPLEKRFRLLYLQHCC